MSLKDEIFSRSIMDLGLSPNTASNLACRTERYKELSRTKGYRGARNLFSTVTVREVVDSFGGYASGENPTRSQRDLFRKLEDLGLTRLDCIFLHQRTVNRISLTKLDRESLLNQPALVLGLSNQLIEELRWVLDDKGEGDFLHRAPTIGDLLNFKLDPGVSEMTLFERFEVSMRRARDLEQAAQGRQRGLVEPLFVDRGRRKL